jgi:hypothetical protein
MIRIALGKPSAISALGENNFFIEQAEQTPRLLLNQV